MKDELLRTIFDLIKIPSVSGNESAIADVLDYCKKFFDGKNVHIKEFKYKDASPVLLISNHAGEYLDILTIGHLDVVPAEEKMFIPEIIDGKIYGRGSGDMKSQVAVALYNMLYVVENRLPIKYGILLTTDEETTSNGIKEFVKNENLCPEVVLDCDAGNLSTIIEKYKHSVGVKLTANGVDGHSSRPWNGINAIEKLINAIEKLQQYFPKFSKELPMPEDTWLDTMALTAFNSPITMNVIPAKAETLINFRLTEKTSLEKLKKILTDACLENSCEYEITMASCGCYMDVANENIQAYKTIAEKVSGEKIKITHMNGATDARMFADRATIIMHGINGDNFHNKGEYAEIESIFKFIEIQREFIEYIKYKQM